MKHALITGGAGFIGSHLAEALIARGSRVTVIDDDSTGTIDNLAAIRDHFYFNLVVGSCADKRLVREVLQDVDEVYHLAAADGPQIVATAPVHAMETAVYTAELLLLELSRLAKAGRVVKLFLGSSSAVYGQNLQERLPENASIKFGELGQVQWSLGLAKALTESLALAYWRQNQLPVVIGRFFNVVGPRQVGEFGAVLPRFVESALHGRPPMVFGNGQQRRCFLHVSDAVEAMLALMEQDAATGQAFNIGGEDAISIVDLALKVVEIARPGLGVDFQQEHAAYGEGFQELAVSVPDLTRIRKVIDFRPSYTLEGIIREVVAMTRVRLRMGPK